MQTQTLRSSLSHLALRSAVLACTLLAAGSAGAQFGAVGLSTVRGQHFGNENLLFYVPQAGDELGFSLAVGDFNGDGADDLASGLPFDDGLVGGEIVDSGSVVVRYGIRGSGLDPGLASTFLRQTPGLDPPDAGDWFGRALAACDFNDDGYDDLAIGVPGEEHLGKVQAGAVQIHYGSATGIAATGNAFYTQSTPGIPGDVESYDEFGRVLACGDFNGDGFADLVIGVPYETFEGIGYHLQEGFIEVIPGSAVGLVPGSATSLDQDSSGMNGSAEPSDNFGGALAAGDFNGDGYDDLAVGVPNEDFNGAVQIVFGGPSGLTSAGNLLWDETYVGGLSEYQDKFGAALAAGDFDGDGHDDLAIGIPYEDFGAGGSEYDCGQVNVLFGVPGGFDRGRTQFWAEDNIYSAGTSEYDDRFGAALAVGDFDRDGYDDLVVGHPWEDLTGPDMGAVTILMGSANRLTNTRRLFLEAGRNGVPGGPPQSLRYFGFALASGDFDGDGHDDLGIGIPGDDVPGILDVGGEIALYGSLFGDGFESGDLGFWSSSVGESHS